MTYVDWRDALEPGPREVADLMSDISEEHYSAGWLIGLEFSLWRIVIGGPDVDRDFGMFAVEPEVVDRLRAPSDACGGWIAWSEDPVDGAVFVPLAEWEARYATRVQP